VSLTEHDKPAAKPGSAHTGVLQPPSAELLHAVLEHFPDAVTVTDLHGRVTDCNRATLKLHGFSARDEISGHPVFEFVHPDDLDRVRGAFQAGIDAASGGKMEYRLRHSDGHYLWVESVGHILLDDEGRVKGAILGSRDITECKETEDKLRQTASELEAVFQAIPDLFFRFSADGTYQEMLAGRPSDLYMAAEDVLGRRVQDLSKRLGQQCQRAIEQVLETRSLVVVEYPLPFEGETRFFEARFLPLLEDQVIMVVRNITEHKRAEERLRYLSFHDIMTGLYNRSYFDEEIRRLDTRRQMPLSVIIGDIDGLKLINDTFGHRKGDRLIIKAAAILKSSCRSEDIVCRRGGDEFAILLPKTDRDTAEVICARIRKACERVKGDLAPNISLGIATKLDVQENIDDILREAEDMMYSNKLNSSSSRFTYVAYFQRSLAEKTREAAEQGRRIQDLALKMGDALELPGKEKDELVILSVLHDIGEIAIPEKILQKPGSLTPEEWQIVKKHPVIGNNIAKSAPSLTNIAEAILSHHERWDGQGYPYGLEGDQIPRFSRILSIADAYQSMVGGRPYRRAISHQEAMEEIRRCSGSQFEPELVELFIKIMTEN
jgi:diguanylate cyclase (GGDEF)-like protein/PAS domain S-box-containing protein